jgi:uncharacterized protein (TIGR01319 family)
MLIKADNLRTVLVTDCGSTTTKALLFEKTEAGWRQTCRGEAPTTVEEPVADVTVGALNAFTEIEELSGRRLLRTLKPAEGEAPFLFSGNQPGQGIDLYLSTSSAGGGLQMLVAGLVRQMTTESAERAALGAGAIILDALSADDTRPEHERIERIRHLRPDIVLMTGGVDGGSRAHVIELAELLRAAAPRPRFGDTLKLPVIYAGNKEAAEEVLEILGPIAQVQNVENLRPTLERENLSPAREAIHEFFLSHVMSHSPGYGKLLSWSPQPVLPTPAAVGEMTMRHATKNNLQVLCADIGGATTDVFSAFRDEHDELVFNRTVSANLGMSYSVANVLLEAGVEGIQRWLPYDISAHEVRDRLRNKMIRPTSIPQTLEDLWLEQAVCREALRLSLEHHRSLAVGLSGVKRSRGISEIFTQSVNRVELVDLMKLDVVIGSGGVLSHAPSRMGAALMMLEGFGLRGLTQITVDSIFMMPHLGVLASVHPQAADEIFIHDCLVNIAHSVVPVLSKKAKAGDKLCQVHFEGRSYGCITAGEIRNVELCGGSRGNLLLEPSAGVDVGAGPGKVLEREIEVGCCGLLLDGRISDWFASETAQVRAARRLSEFKSLGLA